MVFIRKIIKHIMIIELQLHSSGLCLRALHLLIVRQNMGQWPHRCNTKRINLHITCVILRLNVLQQRRVLKCWYIPIQMPNPVMDCGKSRADVLDVALEELDVDGVETNDGVIEADVGFRESGAPEVGPLGASLSEMAPAVSRESWSSGSSGASWIALSTRINASRSSVSISSSVGGTQRAWSGAGSRPM